MSNCLKFLTATLLLVAATSAIAVDDFIGIGREATAAEVRAWDIDVRPDFLGLPPGSGSVEQGRKLYVEQCAGCHGMQGESNNFFTPLIGGTTEDDIASGKVKSLVAGAQGPRDPTVFMKMPTISTLFDYIWRAMPWYAPKSLSPDQVYAVTAYLLNLAQIVPEDFTLSESNIADVQARLPNRHGVTTDHGLWPGGDLGNGGQPDVNGDPCVKDCATESKASPPLSAAMRDAHGNLAEQNRGYGPVRGIPAGTE